MDLIRAEEINIQTEDQINLNGWAYWPGGKDALDEKKPFLILCHGLPPAPPASEVLADGPPAPAVLADEPPMPDVLADGPEGSAEPEEVLADGPEGPVEPEEEDGGYAALARQCTTRLGLPSFHFNYRGAGASGGDFDLLGWCRDLTAFLDYWEQKRGVRQGFTLWGFSAGGTVSAYVAAADPRVKNLIIAASPVSFREIFREEDLAELILRFRHTGIIRDPDFPPEPRQWLQNIHTVEPLPYLASFAPRPLLIIHGSGDELIPLHHAYRLYDAAGPGKELIILPGARHQLRKEKEAVESCLSWLEKVL